VSSISQVFLLALFRVSVAVPNLISRADSLPIATVLAELEEGDIRLILGYSPSSCEKF
jgi:hypothetical protein